MDQKAVTAAADLTGRRFGSFSEATRGVLEMLEQQLPGSAVFVGHLDNDDDQFRIIDARGDESFELEAGVSIDLNESFCIRMATGQAPNLTGDAKADPVYGALNSTDELDIGSYVGVPLEVGVGQPVGSLCAITHDLQAYSETDLQLLRVMANLLSFQLERDRTQHSLEELTLHLREQALTDPLTGLSNRRAFEQGLERELTLTQRDAIPSYLVLLDLDHFKAINDEHGHAVGDRALVAFAGALREVSRGTDIVARLGGDEFGVVLVRALNRWAAERFADRLRKALERESKTLSLPIQASAGAVALTEVNSVEAALDAADMAMYADKRSRAAAR